MYDITWEEHKERTRLEDKTLNVRFYWGTEPDGLASVREGRKIEVPVEMLHIRIPGDRQTDLHVRAVAEWKKFGGEIVTYAMRFEDQYRRFRASQAQVVSGTPLTEAQFLNEGERSILKALDIHTVEQLAGLSGQSLKNVGPGGLKWQQEAEQFIKTTRDNAEVVNLIRENAELKESMAGLVSQAADPKLKYAEVADATLKEMIKDKTGEAPRGNPSRPTLIRMLLDIEAQAQAPAKAA